MSGEVTLIWVKVALRHDQNLLSIAKNAHFNVNNGCFGIARNNSGC
jgi:hypothetical protein